MCTLYESIISLCNERGIKGGKMCVDLGLSKSLLSDLKAGRKKRITSETAQKIADYFSVSVDRVLHGEQKEKPSTGSGEGEHVLTFYENYSAFCRKNGIDPCSAEMADKIGVSRAAITGWNKKGTKPREDKYKVIAEALGVDIDVVFSWAAEHEQKEKPAIQSDDGPAKHALLAAIDDMSEEELSLLLDRAKKIKDSRV